jgi:hypothetical protein
VAGCRDGVTVYGITQFFGGSNGIRLTSAHTRRAQGEWVFFACGVQISVLANPARSGEPPDC